VKDLIEEITKLTDEWRSLTASDHCKDKDFHWYIETKWSYGNPPKYTVWHHGYILDRIEEDWNTYELALERLKEILTREIEEYIKDSEVNNDETGW